MGGAREAYGLSESLKPAPVLNRATEPGLRKPKPAGNTVSSCIKLITLEMLTSITLLTELLLGFRTDDAKRFKRLLKMGPDELRLERVSELLNRSAC